MYGTSPEKSTSLARFKRGSFTKSASPCQYCCSGEHLSMFQEMLGGKQNIAHFGKGQDSQRKTKKPLYQMCIFNDLPAWTLRIEWCKRLRLCSMNVIVLIAVYYSNILHCGIMSVSPMSDWCLLHDALSQCLNWQLYFQGYVFWAPICPLLNHI